MHYHTFACAYSICFILAHINIPCILCFSVINFTENKYKLQIHLQKNLKINMYFILCFKSSFCPYIVLDITI